MTGARSTACVPLMAHRPWTEEDDNTLREAAADGEGYIGLAQHLGRTVHAVRRRARKIGIWVGRGRPPDEGRMLAVLELIKEGLSMRAISHRIGIKHTGVNRIIWQMVRYGLIQRTGGKTNQVRYVVPG